MKVSNVASMFSSSCFFMFRKEKEEKKILCVLKLLGYCHMSKCCRLTYLLTHSFTRLGPGMFDHDMFQWWAILREDMVIRCLYRSLKIMLISFSRCISVFCTAFFLVLGVKSSCIMSWRVIDIMYTHHNKV